MTTTGLLLNCLEAFAKPLARSSAPGFSLAILATNWGFEGTHDQFATKVKAAGYDGVEVWVPGDEKDREGGKNKEQQIHGVTSHFSFATGAADRAGRPACVM